jgi:phage/plasmid primase-like uncharacterized protein
MSKYFQNKKVNAYRKRLQSERRIIEKSKKAPMTTAERMRRMKQRRQVEASASRAEATTPDASSQAMDVDSEIEPMECNEIQADETFGNRDLVFITHWRLATGHFQKAFYGNKLGFVC